MEKNTSTLKSDINKQNAVETELVTLGRRKDWTHGVVNPPIYPASTCIFDTYQQLRDRLSDPWAKELFYGRKGTPTQWSLEEAITSLHHGECTHLFPSGVAALAAALLAVTKSGDHILITDSAYEPTRGIADTMLKRFGVAVSYYSPGDENQLEKLMQDNTAAILVEAPGSLTFEMQDIPAIAKLAASHPNKPFIIADNTWATPLFCQPLNLGADLVVEAVTKYIGGHSDVMMGSVSANKRAAKKLQQSVVHLGQVVSADEAALALRGLRTLSVRLKYHETAALKVAKWLENHPAISKVLYPALESDPGYSLWQRDMSGATGLFSIILKKGDYPDTARIVDDMKLFKMGFSWGGYESLILPSNPSDCRTVTPWEAPGPLLRLHIGLENTDDLLIDLAQALDRY